MSFKFALSTLETYVPVTGRNSLAAEFLRFLVQRSTISLSSAL